MKFLNLAVLILAIVVSAAGRAVDSGKTTERTVTKLAEGIYTIRHKDAPDTFPQGNTTVVIGEREVLVVDSCYLPSSAREDIADIRRCGARTEAHRSATLRAVRKRSHRRAGRAHACRAARRLAGREFLAGRRHERHLGARELMC